MSSSIFIILCVLSQARLLNGPFASMQSRFARRRHYRTIGDTQRQITHTVVVYDHRRCLINAIVNASPPPHYLSLYECVAFVHASSVGIKLITIIDVDQLTRTPRGSSITALDVRGLILFCPLVLDL